MRKLILLTAASVVLLFTAIYGSQATSPSAYASPIPTEQFTTLEQANAISPACRYVVVPGDTLARIAARYQTTWPMLATANDIPNPNWIYVGQVLNVCHSLPVPPVRGKPLGAIAPGEPCHSTDYANGPVYMWKVPPSCFALIYWPNPSNYPQKPGYGWCNWWPEVLHPSENIFSTPRHASPRLGAVVAFAPGVQGASRSGHWGGEVLWISPNGAWVLISEMNMWWRGGGFARVNYRYVLVEPGVSFVY